MSTTHQKFYILLNYDVLLLEISEKEGPQGQDDEPPMLKHTKEPSLISAKRP